MNQPMERNTYARTAIAGAVALLAMGMAAQAAAQDTGNAASAAAGGQPERPGEAQTVIVTGVLVLAWFLPRHVAPEDPRPWRLRGLTVPRGLGGTFATAVLAATGLVLAMLIGVNIGPNLTYTGSLATLLWRRVLHRNDRKASLKTFTLLGLATVPACVVAAVAALWAVMQFR